ncbi:MAG: hypothetical protein JST64_12945, partial [Actinobacteria bacterium]|nr:hypothetical protein [Actinomycetota bacterium]
IGMYAIFAFGAWAQMPSALNTAMWTAFAVLITIPVLGMLGVLGDNVRRGTVTVSPALVLSLLAVLLLLGAVVTGWIQALSLAGEGRLFGASPATLAAAQSAFVAVAAIAGGLAASMHWSPLLWGGSAAAPESRLTVPLVLVGGGLLATATLAQAVVQLDGATTSSQVFGALEAAGAILFALGALSGLIAAVRTADGGDGGDHAAEGGLTLEWSFPSPAGGGVGLVDLPRVGSPYPLLDARHGSDEEKD